MPCHCGESGGTVCFSLPGDPLGNRRAERTLSQKRLSRKPDRIVRYPVLCRCARYESDGVSVRHSVAQVSLECIRLLSAGDPAVHLHRRRRWGCTGISAGIVRQPGTSGTGGIPQGIRVAVLSGKADLSRPLRTGGYGGLSGDKPWSPGVDGFPRESGRDRAQRLSGKKRTRISKTAVRLRIRRSCVCAP